MAERAWKVEFYSKASGRCPAEEFLDALPRQDLVFIVRAFDRLEEYGPHWARPDVGYLRDSIWELRRRTKHGRYRLLFFIDGRTLVMSHGIKKRTAKVPDVEIDSAIAHRND